MYIVWHGHNHARDPHTSYPWKWQSLPMNMTQKDGKALLWSKCAYFPMTDQQVQKLSTTAPSSRVFTAWDCNSTETSYWDELSRPLAQLCTISLPPCSAVHNSPHPTFKGISKWLLLQLEPFIRKNPTHQALAFCIISPLFTLSLSQVGLSLKFHFINISWKSRSTATSWWTIWTVQALAINVIRRNANLQPVLKLVI